MATQYVVRQNAFFYTDEWYECITDGDIYQVFDSEEEAQGLMRHLNREALRDCENLNEYGLFCGGGYTKQFDAWLAEIGVELDDLPAFLQEQASDEQIDRFVDLSGFGFFYLMQMDNDEKFYVAEVLDDVYDGYLALSAPGCEYSNDGLSGMTWFGNSPDFIKEDTKHLCQAIYDMMPPGSLAELSDSPELLKQFFENAKTLRYDEKSGRIKWTHYEPDWGELQALNALLKQPVFRVREVSLTELAEI